MNERESPIEGSKQPLKWGGVFRRLIQPLITEQNNFGSTIIDNEVWSILQQLNLDAAQSVRANVGILRDDLLETLTNPQAVTMASPKIMEDEKCQQRVPVLRGFSIGYDEKPIRLVRAQAYIPQNGKDIRDYQYPGIPELHIVLEDVVPSDLNELVGKRSNIEAALSDGRLSGDDGVIGREALLWHDGLWATRLKIVFGTSYWQGHRPHFVSQCILSLHRMADDAGDDDRIVVQFGVGIERKFIRTRDLILSKSGVGPIQSLDKLESKLTALYDAIGLQSNIHPVREFYQDKTFSGKKSIGAFTLLALDE
jgi:hypothetical protein